MRRRKESPVKHPIRRSSSVTSALLVSGLVLVDPLAAHAQQTDPDPAKRQQPEEIVVRGEKVERDLYETLSSVSVTTGQQILERGDQRITDILERTPGVFVGSSGQAISIRGVPLEGLSARTGADAFSVYV